jgi:tRNA(adenine34) deaminase
VTDDATWMAAALRAARAAGRRGEVPVGAVVVRAGRALGRGGNRTRAGHDPSAHAEIVALRRAARTAGNHRLVGATVYVTLEPCLMCLGAMVQARVARVVFGAEDPKTGATALLASAEIARRVNHRFEVTGGVLAGPASALLSGFFRERRGRRRPAAGAPARGSGPARPR